MYLGAGPITTEEFDNLINSCIYSTLYVERTSQPACAFHGTVTGYARKRTCSVASPGLRGKGICCDSPQQRRFCVHREQPLGLLKMRLLTEMSGETGHLVVSVPHHITALHDKIRTASHLTYSHTSLFASPLLQY